jgi:hypothetical protein
MKQNDLGKSLESTALLQLGMQTQMKWPKKTQKKDRNNFLIKSILNTAWLESHALTLKNNTAKYCFGEKSRVNVS